MHLRTYLIITPVNLSFFFVTGLLIRLTRIDCYSPALYRYPFTELVCVCVAVFVELLLIYLVLLVEEKRNCLVFFPV
jgi:hypothetical protein